ncbi:MAG: glycosyltransferase [Lachnospiraceae bacterium]|nr:glycosyltransferase [Lachnospiraceae bacterium]
MKKVFICAHANFPRGGAEANYIEYLALALKDIGYKVYVFSRGSNDNEDWNEENQCYCHNEIFYYNIEGSYHSTVEFAKEYFDESKKNIQLLDRFLAAEDDCIITYSTNYFYIKKLYQYACTKKMQLITTVVEWYQPFQYKGGIFNPVYWLDNIGFEYGIPISGKVLPISSYLEKHFQKKRCETLCLPIMADVSQNQMLQEKKEQAKVQFIYSGNPFHKDAIDVILDSFCALSNEELQKIVIHFTGMSKTTKDLLRKKFPNQLERLKNQLIIHEWLSYEELMELYRKIDFLTLFRRENKVTLANFPSKIPEMMTYGIIPIVSDVGDYTNCYLSNDKDSICMKDCSVEMGRNVLSRAINMKKEEKRMMQNETIKTVRDKFDYRNWVNSIRGFLECNT